MRNSVPCFAHSTVVCLRYAYFVVGAAILLFSVEVSSMCANSYTAAVRVFTRLNHAFNKNALVTIPMGVVAIVIMSYLDKAADQDQQSQLLLNVAHDYCVLHELNDTDAEELHQLVGKALYIYYKERNKHVPT